MTETTPQTRDASKLVEEINAVVLLDPSDTLPDPSKDKPTAEAVAKAIAELDMRDTNSIVSFGSRAQAELQVISQSMLDGVRNKDVGPAGASLRDIVGTIRGFSVDELDPTRKISWWDRLLGRAKPVHDFLARYETVQGQIDKITEDLLRHEHQLMRDIKSLDQLYEKTLNFYDALAIYTWR